jgi:electron transfer flavoprotein alpha subunit
MRPVLSYVAVRGGAATRASLEALTRCRALAAKTGAPLAAVVLAADPSGAAAEAARYGAETVYTVADPAFEQLTNASVVAALAEVVRQAGPSVVAFPSSEGTKDVLGALAARLSSPALPDVSAFELRDGGVEALRPVMAAKFLARVRAEAPEGTPVLVSVRSGSYTAEEAPAEGSLHAVSFEVPTAGPTLREVVSAASGAVDLSEASVVVAAGRGVRDEAGRQLVEELAEATGAAIGASRAVVESGLFPASAQIGQTGKVVSPDLYFAVGLSGAIQHVAGMTNSRIIVAINRDADAPIFQVATYGLVGDLYQILPALTEAIRQAKGA